MEKTTPKKNAPLFCPLVSVIIPTYNQATFLQEALLSLLEQSYSNLEVVIMDDGSTDSTPAVCQTFMTQDQRIRYFRQTNRGPSAARNQAIIHSTGSYLCLLDSDDRMEPNKIELQLQIFADDPSIDVVYTALYLIDAAGKRIGEIRSQSFSPADFLAHMFFRNVIPNPNTIMIKRECLIHHPYNEHFKHAEDYELMLRLAHLYRFKYLDTPLTSYRRHASNLSNDLDAHRQSELKVLQSYGKEHIEEAIDHSSLSPDEKVLLKGKVLFNMELFHEAILRLRPLDSPLALFYLGNCYFLTQQWQQAKGSYALSLQLDPTNPACYNNLGATYLLLQDLVQARSCFEKALQLRANYMDASYNLSHIEESVVPKFTKRELRQDLIPYSVENKNKNKNESESGSKA